MMRTLLRLLKNNMPPATCSDALLTDAHFAVVLTLLTPYVARALVSLLAPSVYTLPRIFQVVHELLGTPEGCELYLLAPEVLGCSVDETIKFSEVQAVGQLLQKTVIGVVTGGMVLMAPEREWRWTVQAGDRVATIALSWD